MFVKTDVSELAFTLQCDVCALELNITGEFRELHSKCFFLNDEFLQVDSGGYRFPHAKPQDSALSDVGTRLLLMASLYHVQAHDCFMPVRLCEKDPVQLSKLN